MKSITWQPYVTIDEWTNEWVNKRKNEWVKELMTERVNERMNECPISSITRCEMMTQSIEARQNIDRGYRRRWIYTTGRSQGSCTVGLPARYNNNTFRLRNTGIFFHLSAPSRPRPSIIRTPAVLHTFRNRLQSVNVQMIDLKIPRSINCMCINHQSWLFFLEMFLYGITAIRNQTNIENHLFIQIPHGWIHSSNYLQPFNTSYRIFFYNNSLNRPSIHLSSLIPTHKHMNPSIHQLGYIHLHG